MVSWKEAYKEDLTTIRKIWKNVKLDNQVNQNCCQQLARLTCSFDLSPYKIPYRQPAMEYAERVPVPEMLVGI